MSDDSIVPFNPLDKRHLGESVGQAMLRQPLRPLTELEPFPGAGIYAIYYRGDFEAYEPIASRNRGERPTAPIYVGKAIPGGARKGKKDSSSNQRPLHGRLNEHRKSLTQVTNLDADDFMFRALIVDDIWIPLGESLLIAKFNPLWNTLIDGFGNHDPGKGRREGVKPRWDVVHPGRSWAEYLQDRNETAEQILAEVREYLSSNPPPDDETMITA